MEKEKYLITHEDGGTVVRAEDDESALDFLIEHPIPGASENYLMNAEVEKVTGSVYRVKAELYLGRMGGPIQNEFVFAVASPEEAEQKVRGYNTILFWEGATILSVEEVTEVLEA